MPVQRVMLRVIAVISLAIALVSQAVSFRTHWQPAELELSMSCQQHELTQHELPTAEPAWGPRPGITVVFCGLQVCCMSLRLQPCKQQVEQGLAHSHSRVQAERP